MMTSEQAAGLARAGFELGGHTVTHPILAKLDLREAADEIARGRSRLADVAGSPIRLFAYPNGRPDRDYRKATAGIVEELGFDGAVTTASGAARVGSDPFQVPRFTPWDLRAAGFLRQIGSNLFQGTVQHASA
jgi:peptidoglycan/xylan/chitin deacetylase (PgdA/CDA1 family)